jgi:formylglycine-generating enzyme required for sulfatase activity
VLGGIVLALTSCAAALTWQALAESATTRPAPPSIAPASREGLETLGTGETRCLRAKDVFQDCDACPQMIVVPAGEFTMGSDENDEEKPLHGVAIAGAFARVEV